MKSVFKHFSKKAISAILAFAVIVGSITATVGVFADSNRSVTPYEVTYGSPAIPMFKDKLVELKNVKVQFTEGGQFVDGEDITWSAADSKIANSLDTVNKKLYAFGTGTFKVTAAYNDGTNDYSREIYVIVNEQDDYNFYLVNLNFANSADYVADDWYGTYSYSTGTQLTNNYYYMDSKPTLSNGRLELGYVKWSGYGGTGGAGTNAYFYNNPVLNDFSDYTLEAEMRNGADDLNGGMSYEYHIATFLRAPLNTYNKDGEAFANLGTDGENKTVLMCDLKRFGGVGMAAIGKGSFLGNDSRTINTSLFSGNIYDDITNISSPDFNKVTSIKNAASWDNGYPNYAVNANGVTAPRKIAVTLNGNDVKYSIDGNVLLDSASNDIKQTKMSFKNPNEVIAAFTPATSYSAGDFRNNVAGAHKTGAIGFGGTQNHVYLYSLKVKLNTAQASDMPAMSDIALYTISNASPALPMFVNTTVDLGSLVVEFEDGMFVPGNALIWTLEDATANVEINNTAKAIKAYGTGVYKISARRASDNQTKTIYAVVNAQGDYNFYIVNLNFANATDYVADDWKVAVSRSRGDQLVSNYKYDDESSWESWAKTSVTGGALKLGYNYNRSWEGGNGTVAHFYVNPVLEQFSNYTIEMSALMDGADYRAPSFEYHLSVFMRAPLNTDYTKGNETFTNLGLGGGKQTVLVGALKAFGGIGLANIGGNGAYVTNNSQWVNASFFSGDVYDKITNLENPDYNWVLSTVYRSAYTPGSTPKYSKGTNSSTPRNIAITLNGNNIKYSVNGNTVLDTAGDDVKSVTFVNTGEICAEPNAAQSYSADTIRSNISSCATKGAIGFGATQNSLHLYSLKVKLNVSSDADMPASSPITNSYVYEVKGTTPAIPMFVNTKVNLNNVGFQFNDGGRWYSGSELTWSVDDSCTDKGSVVVNDNTKTVAAVKTGVYALRAVNSNGTEEGRFYAIVNNTGDTEFKLADLDFTKAGSYVAGEWLYGTNPGPSCALNTSDFKDTDRSSVVCWSDNGLSVGVRPSNTKEYGANVLLYNNLAMRDFSDYTIKASLVHPDTEDGTKAATGFIARADADATNGKIFAQPSGALTILRRNIGGIKISGIGGDTTTIHTVADSELLKYTSPDSSYVWRSTAKDAQGVTNAEKVRKFVITLKGTSLKYELDGNTIFDSAAAKKYTMTFPNPYDFYIPDGNKVTFDPKNPDATADANAIISESEYTGSTDVVNKKGTVGFTFVRDGALIKSFEVCLEGLTAVPSAITEPYSYYIVTADSPVLPMTAGYRVGIDQFLVQIGTKVYETADLTITSTDNTGVTVAGGYINVLKTGVYTLNVKVNATGETQKLYVVAKGENETEYTLYYKDLRADDADVGDFSTVIVNGSGAVIGEYTGNYAKELDLPGFVPYNANTVAALVQQGFDDGKGTYTRESSAYTILKNDVVSALANYRITVTMRNYTGVYGGVGLVGRVSDATGGKYTPGTSAAYGFVHTPNGAWLESGIYALNGNTYANMGAGSWNTVPAGSAVGFTDRAYTATFTGTTVRFVNDVLGDENAVVNSAVMQTGAVGVLARLNSYNKRRYGPVKQKDGTTQYEWIDTNLTIDDAQPIILDFKVTLPDVDVSTLPTEKVTTVNRELKGSGYTDNGNYTFKVGSNSIGGYVRNNDGVPYSSKVVIPASVGAETASEIGYNVFWSNAYTRTREFVIGEGLTSVLDNAFRDNMFIETVTFPESFETIYNNVFMSSGLVNLNISNNIVSIGESAFFNNASLKSIKFGNEYSSLRTIGKNAFFSCVALREVKLPLSLKSLGTTAFNGCTSLKDVYVYNRNMIFGADDTSSGKPVGPIPSTATIYGATGSTAEAYANAHGNRFVPIDNEVIAAEAAEAARLAAIEAEAERKASTTDTGAAYTVNAIQKNGKQSYEINGFKAGSNPDAGRFMIPAEIDVVENGKSKRGAITAIKANAFKNSADKRRVYNVVLPEGITSIGDSAFEGCANLRHITMPSTLTEIGSYAFRNTAFKELTISASVASIGNGAFAGAGNLKTLNFATNDTFVSVLYSIGESAFAETSVEEVNLPINVRNIGKKAFDSTPLRKVTINNPNAKIGEDAFPSATQFHVIGGSETEKNLRALGYTNIITDVANEYNSLLNRELGGTFTYTVAYPNIYVSSYSGNGGKVTIPRVIDYTADDGTVTKNMAVNGLQYNTFDWSNDKYKVYSLVLPEGIYAVNASAFINCKNLSEVTFPDTLTKIDQFAFTATNLKGTIKFGMNVISIGVSAFGGTGITDVYIYNPNCEVATNAFPKGTVIHAPKGSKAETFVKKYEEDVNCLYKFVEIEKGTFKSIDKYADNKNYVFTVDSSKASITGYSIADAGKPYSEKVVIPANVNGVEIKTIGNGLFRAKPYSASLFAVVISEGIENIGDGAFSTCLNLNKVSFPSSLKTIGSNAFSKTSLSGDIVIPESVTKIGGSAFANCSKLSSVTITNPTCEIGKAAFNGIPRGFVIRGLKNSTAYEYYLRNKSAGIIFESLGDYEKPAEENPDTRNNDGDGDDDGTNTTVVTPAWDLTIIIVVALAALLLLLLLGAVIIVIVVVNKSDDDDDDYDDDYDDDDYDDDDYDEDDYDDEDEDEDLDDDE